jgi:HNH endonuclease
MTNFGPRPNFLRSYDYQAIWREQAKANRRTGRDGLLSESGDDPDTLRRLPYWRYLRTTHWDRVRRRALAIAEHQCFYCGAPEDLDVHHLSYKRRGCELDEDLIVLCRACHYAEHETEAELNEARALAARARGHAA